MWWMRGEPKRRFWTAMGQLPSMRCPGSAKHPQNSAQAVQEEQALATATGQFTLVFFCCVYKVLMACSPKNKYNMLPDLVPILC